MVFLNFDFFVCWKLQIGMIQCCWEWNIMLKQIYVIIYRVFPVVQIIEFSFAKI